MIQKSPLTIVIVNDHLATIISIEKLLHIPDFNVRTALSGHDVLQLFNEQPADILITGIKMPQMNGLELTEKILNQYPDTIIIGISADNNFLDAVNFMKKGGMDIVQEPVTFEQINAAIQDAIKHQQLKNQQNMNLLQAESQIKNDYLANASHDLKTPLNSILGYTQLLARDKSLQKKHQEYIQIIHNCGEQLLLLVNDILELSKIQANKMERKQKAVDFYLDDFLTRIVNICQIFAHQKKIDLQLIRASNCPDYVQGDEKCLQQVLLNLINNAIKFTDQGQVVLEVSMVDEKIRFTVKDTGIGISKHNLQQIFKPFHQLDNYTLKTEGTGLGLTISKRMVQLMGGDIYVESTENKGSTFWFDILLPEQYVNISRTPSGHFKEEASESESEKIVPPDLIEVEKMVQLALTGNVLRIEQMCPFGKLA
ncbi:MAG: response regulator [Candidatus Magnetomorum sp.]|nr:response regulator [Candidatus Magnetomorum sp.]